MRMHQLDRHCPEDAADVDGFAKDPMCGMSVDPASAPERREHAGETYHFCSKHCATRFEAAPERYLGDRQGPAPSGDTIYTCPMHPEIEQVGPGDCPICGMALEPKTASGAT
jgi:P-type Cu+ transporter